MAILISKPGERYIINLLDATMQPGFAFWFCLVLFDCLGIFFNLFYIKALQLGFFFFSILTAPL